MIPVISLVAYSGTGKTTLLEKLIPELKKRGLRVAVIKHDGHDFEIDHEGKDSYRITASGADLTGLISENRSVVMENRKQSPEQVISGIRDVDLIITEGFKHGPWPKIMLHRAATGKALPLDPSSCLAVISDVFIEGSTRLFSPEAISDIADFMENFATGHQGKTNRLKDVPFLSQVDRGTLDTLWKAGRVMSYGKGHILLHHKTYQNQVLILLSGKCFFYNLTHHGSRKIIFIMGEGALLNDHVMNEHASSLYCETLEKSEVFAVPVKIFADCMARDFALSKAVLLFQEWKMWRMGHQLKNTTGNIFLERKLAAKLWKLSRDFGIDTPEGREIDINLSITFLSDMLGAPRETTSRICKTLVENGYIRMNKKRITIVDPDKMSRFYKEGSL